MTKTVTSVKNKEQLEEIRRLFREYSDSLDIDLGFQYFEEEIAGLPNGYAPPDGCLLLAIIKQQTAGCIALRKLDDEICEMKRLYVSPPFRQLGIGKLLAEAVIANARKIGYQRLRLDTLASMTRAQMLYKALGFYEIAPYYLNPNAKTVYMEINLQTNLANKS